MLYCVRSKENLILLITVDIINNFFLPIYPVSKPCNLLDKICTLYNRSELEITKYRYLPLIKIHGPVIEPLEILFMD